MIPAIAKLSFVGIWLRDTDPIVYGLAGKSSFEVKLLKGKDSKACSQHKLRELAEYTVDS